MLAFRNGDDLYPYCKDCVHSEVIPDDLEPLGCTIGDDAEVKQFSDKVKTEDLDPEGAERCPGFDGLANVTPGVGDMRSAMIQMADVAEAGMMKDIPAELRPHSEDEWQSVLDDTLDELRFTDPESAGRIGFARDMVNKHQRHSRSDVEQEYDYFGELEEHPSGNITYPKHSSRNTIVTIRQSEQEFYDFLKQSGFDDVSTPGEARRLVVTAMTVWRDGFLKNSISNDSVQMVIDGYRVH